MKDPDNKVADLYEARHTPEVFVVDPLEVPAKEDDPLRMLLRVQTKKLERGACPSERAEKALKGFDGKRLTYRQPIGKDGDSL